MVEVDIDSRRNLDKLEEHSFASTSNAKMELLVLGPLCAHFLNTMGYRNKIPSVLIGVSIVYVFIQYQSEFSTGK